ncbi:hypothetical protein [Aureimonas mangrovi]|uniref:hypothetical protein n=1 Tax=Aureimonas mangrovi TaxID=2758041 RepID=UPI00163D9B13|nr:hypothetical protein [Aureimonas mangrovi]
MPGRRKVFLADRLTVLLKAELTALEAARKVERADADEDVHSRPAEVKARVEAVSQITRTLEKLLELRRLEALGEAEGEDEAETGRLRDELMARLRALDARREAGAGLFAPKDAEA